MIAAGGVAGVVGALVGVSHVSHRSLQRLSALRAADELAALRRSQSQSLLVRHRQPPLFRQPVHVLVLPPRFFQVSTSTRRTDLSVWRAALGRIIVRGPLPTLKCYNLHALTVVIITKYTCIYIYFYTL